MAIIKNKYIKQTMSDPTASPQPQNQDKEQKQQVQVDEGSAGVTGSQEESSGDGGQQQQTQELEKLVQELKIDGSNSPAKDGEEASEQQANSAEQSQKQPSTTKEFIEISKSSIVFGRTPLFPGSIQEVDLSITLKDDDSIDGELNEPFLLRVIAKCSNPEFDALDEYVFSVRSNDRYEYFEEVRFRIKKKERANVKVAVKIPPVKENYTLSGYLEIQLQGLAPVMLPMSAICQFPQLTCMKDLYKADEGCSMIKVPAKKNMIRLPPIPFKNLSNFNISLEVQAISNESFSNKPYDIVCQSLVNCQANMQFFVNLQLKENINYKGQVPVRDTIRKILLLKIKNSSVFFNYPLEVNVYESASAGGMS